MGEEPHGRRTDGLKAILLDAGGVLLDLDYGYLRRLVRARRHEVDEPLLSRAEAVARREVERGVVAGRGVTESWRDYFHRLLGEVGVPGEDREGIIDALWAAHQRVGLWTVAIPGAVSAVGELRRSGFRLGVISNAEGQVARDLDNAGFEGMFETVVDSTLVGVEKPDPAIFRIGLDRMRLKPSEAIYVGDLPAVDVVGARSAGLTPVLVDRHDLYPDADAPRLRGLEELPGWLDRDFDR